MQEQKKARNIYADTFTAAYEQHYGLPYSITQADMVQLDQITNKGPLAPRMTLDVFKRGVDHYFESELGVHTLKHLCSAFVPYWRQPLDRYGKPKQRTGGMRAVGEMYDATRMPWQIRFAAKVNAAYDKHPVPERMTALIALFDQMEDEQLDEPEAMKRLEAIEQS